MPTNGLVVYCGTIVTDEGKEKKVNIDFEPFKPINTSLYLCDNKFHTEVSWLSSVVNATSCMANAEVRGLLVHESITKNLRIILCADYRTMFNPCIFSDKIVFSSFCHVIISSSYMVIKGWFYCSSYSQIKETSLSLRKVSCKRIVFHLLS